LAHPESWASAVEAHGTGYETVEAVSPAESAQEMLLMGLRLGEGVHLDRLSRAGGLNLDPERIADLERLGLVARDQRVLRVTDKGRPVLNGIIVNLAA
ncbi:MAG: coproporphyrinogen III oxidase, partial [Pseudomonadota bacterium]